MILKTDEKGQALIMIALAAIGLFAFAALAIDGSRLYSAKRHAQNAADTAVLAAALAYTRDNNLSDTSLEDKAKELTSVNGYKNNGLSDEIVVTVENVPAGDCPGKVTGKDVTVYIHVYLDTTFARVIGRDKFETAVTATSRGCGFYYKPLFDGNAIVGLNPNQDSKGCAFDSGQSNAAHWKIEGSGIFSNGCAHTKDADGVTFDTGKCVTTVGDAIGFGCTPKEDATPYEYPDSVLEIMPPDPCGPGGIGKDPPASGSTFTDGVYCISEFDDYDKKDIVLNNATLYVTDLDFDLKFAGSGGFYGTPTKEKGYPGSEPYSDYYMIIAMTTPCTDFTKGDQVIEWRGNGSGSFYGTILAPSACIDLRGNGDTNGMHTQVIAYTVGSNGNAGDKNEVYINYKQAENHENPVYPTISVLR